MGEGGGGVTAALTAAVLPALVSRVCEGECVAVLRPLISDLLPYILL